jgi:hypothetical protein
MPWQPKALSYLERQNHTLALKLLKANAALHAKTVYAQRLEFLLHQRMERIDQLQGTVDQLRLKNRMLGQENGHLAAMLAPK